MTIHTNAKSEFYGSDDESERDAREVREDNEHRHALYVRQCAELGVRAPLALDAWSTLRERGSFVLASKHLEHERVEQEARALGLEAPDLGWWCEPPDLGEERWLKRAIAKLFPDAGHRERAPVFGFDHLGGDAPAVRTSYLAHRRASVSVGVEPRSFASWWEAPPSDVSNDVAAAIARAKSAAMAHREARLIDARRVTLERADIRLPDDDIDALARRTHRQTEPIAHVDAWLADQKRRRVLVLLGPVGTGKTMAAAHALATHGSGSCVSGRELARLSLAKFGDDLRAFQRLIESSDALVVDEIGADKRVAEDERLALHEVLDSRLRGTRLTVLVGNLAVPDLRTWLNARTYDRLRQHAQVVWCGGESLRGGRSR